MIKCQILCFHFDGTLKVSSLFRSNYIGTTSSQQQLVVLCDSSMEQERSTSGNSLRRSGAKIRAVSSFSRSVQDKKTAPALTKTAWKKPTGVLKAMNAFEKSSAGKSGKGGTSSSGTVTTSSSLRRSGAKIRAVSSFSKNLKSTERKESDTESITSTNTKLKRSSAKLQAVSNFTKNVKSPGNTTPSKKGSIRKTGTVVRAVNSFNQSPGVKGKGKIEHSNFLLILYKLQLSKRRRTCLTSGLIL